MVGSNHDWCQILNRLIGMIYHGSGKNKSTHHYLRPKAHPTRHSIRKLKLDRFNLCITIDMVDYSHTLQNK